MRKSWRIGALGAALLGLLQLAPLAAAQTPGSCGTAPLQGERAALLIGNSAYNDWEWPSLKNAVNDIDYVCAAFAKAGISPRIVRNADMATLDAALTRFAAEAAGAKSVIIYYAGHGFEYGGRNWLVPMEAPPATRRADVEKRYLSIEAAVKRVVPAGAFTLLFVDACRTAEPVVRIEDVNVAAGDAASAPLGLLDIGQGAVFYSTAKGRPALDFAPIGSPVSPFAAAVVKELGIPGLEISDYFKIVSREVYKRTHGMELGPQQPFHYGSWFDDYYLVAPPEVPAAAPVRPTAAAVIPLPSSSATALPSRGAVTDPLADISLDRLAIEDEPVLIADVLSRHPASELIALADGGHPLAQQLAGYMFSLGVGLKKDMPRARAYLEASAAQGFPAGQQELAYLLLENDPSPADVTRAYDLYVAASNAGFSKAKTHLAYRLAAGTFGPADFARSQALYVEAAGKGHPAAIFALTYFADTRAANLARLRTIAATGNPEGNHWLCEAHFAAKTLAGAIEDCGLAARAGFAGSRAILADAYAKGIGVTADAKEAAHWAKLARDLPELRKDQRDMIAGIGE
ncbi:MAG: caspase family protein [Alphaproteobacteria bacterium]|nr:caspase family protein [Alphaproteobacteria bacterium]MBU0863590.1 caspase family protein [Alphaproteobacteria bacterium]MBU1825946.1 caspase family protein [Alphaproteobacteria bacterium]